MTTHRPTVLLTGASGVVGRALLDELEAEHDVICLRGRRTIDDPRVEEFTGDFTHPTVGLPVADYVRLTDRVDAVVHAAAVTKWGEDAAVVRAVNTAGPAAMLRLAADAGAPLYMLSTAFVIRSVPQDLRFAGLAAYLESKLEAEELVRTSPVRHAIVRPSVVVGDSRHGRMAAFQGIHRMLGGVAQGLLPIVPGETGSLVDTVPQDVVAEAVGGLVRERAEGEYWLTAGDASLTVLQHIQLAAELSRDLGIRAPLPRFVPFEAVDRLLLPLLDDVIPPRQQQMFVDLLESMSIFQSTDRLPSDLIRLGFGDRMTHAAQVRTMRRSLNYWAQTKGLLPGPQSPPPAAEVAA